MQWRSNEGVSGGIHPERRFCGRTKTLFSTTKSCL